MLNSPEAAKNAHSSYSSDISMDFGDRSTNPDVWQRDSHRWNAGEEDEPFNASRSGTAFRETLVL